jgi:hypothetical protein
MPQLMRVLAVCTIAGAAQEKDPITDRMRYEIAAAQRDFLIAKQQFDAASAHLKEKIEQADKACAPGGSFDLAKFACIARTAEKKP